MSGYSILESSNHVGGQGALPDFLQVVIGFCLGRFPPHYCPQTLEDSSIAATKIMLNLNLNYGKQQRSLSGEWDTNTTWYMTMPIGTWIGCILSTSTPILVTIRLEKWSVQIPATSSHSGQKWITKWWQLLLCMWKREDTIIHRTLKQLMYTMFATAQHY